MNAHWVVVYDDVDAAPAGAVARPVMFEAALLHLMSATQCFGDESLDKSNCSGPRGAGDVEPGVVAECGDDGVRVSQGPWDGDHMVCGSDPGRQVNEPDDSVLPRAGPVHHQLRAGGHFAGPRDGADETVEVATVATAIDCKCAAGGDDLCDEPVGCRHVSERVALRITCDCARSTFL